jgi:hypothetical protein
MGHRCCFRQAPRHLGTGLEVLEGTAGHQREAPKLPA